MPFVIEQTRRRIEPPISLPGIEEGDWIEIASIYTAGARQRVMKRAMQIHIGVGTNNTPSNEGVSIDAFALRQALLEEIVLAWSDSAPVNPDNLAALPADVADWITEEFDKNVANRTDESKKDSNSNYSPVKSQMSLVTSTKSNGSKNAE